MKIRKRKGYLEELDIAKIQKQTGDATFDLENVSQSELELDAHLKFVEGMKSSDIQDTLIHTAVEKIDIDRPNWTFVAARLFIYDLYHTVGAKLETVKGNTYGSLLTYIKHATSIGKMHPVILESYSEIEIEVLSSRIDPRRDMQFNYLGIKTLADRYLIKNNDGEIIELPQHMFMSIAMFLAQNEKNKIESALEFYNVISKFEVMLATPTLSNARTNRHQLSSCFIGASPDNIEGIFDGYKEKALMSKLGGGIGWDWNSIRSIGGSIDGFKAAAGGTVPFIKIDNDIALAVDQLGTRKGAIAVYLEPWHMDIQDFIDLKKNSGEERRRAHDIFPALWIPDLFMERVDQDAEWTLFDPNEVKDLHTLHSDEFKVAYELYEQNDSVSKKVVKAKALWKQILLSYFEVGSPFLCWKDTANRANPNPKLGAIRSSNLCTEIFQSTSPDKYLVKIYFNHGLDFMLFEESDDVCLVNKLGEKFIKSANKVTSLDTLDLFMYKEPEFHEIVTELLAKEPEIARVYAIEKDNEEGQTAVCNLASINLSRINTIEDIKRVTPIAIRMLDIVIDLNYYPTLKAKNTNMMSRAIGLGVMGEAQMIAERQIHFGSKDHLELINQLMELVLFEAINASSDLAFDKGSYPGFEESNWNNGIFPFDHVNEANRALTDELCNISNWDKLKEKVKLQGMRNGYLMAIAPTSSISILVGTTQAIEPVYKRKWFEENLSGLIPVVVPKLSPETYEFYKPAFEIDQLSIVKAAAIRQRWIDQGQSTNIFANPAVVTGKVLNEIYTLAHKLGCKSTYYLRSQSAEAKKAEMDIADRSIECSGCQ